MIQLYKERKSVTAIVSLVLTLFLSGMASIPAHASVPGNGYYGCATGSFESSTAADRSNRFRIVNGTIVDGTQCAGEVVISDGVTAIGDGSFGSSALTSISLPSSITRIGSNAFQNASGLTAISLPPNLTSIGAQAFSSARSLASISIPDSVSSIGMSAFERTALTSITFPEGITSIPSFAFSNANSLTSVSIPASVSSIGANPFLGTTALTNIAVASSSQSYKSIDGVLFNKEATALLEYPSGKSATSYAIPDGVTSIGDAAFDQVRSLTSIAIPGGATSIGDSTFAGATSLTSIVIPSSVTSIGDSAFAGATSLTSIVIPSSVTSIGDSVFADSTSLASINIPDGITAIGEYLFSHTAITSITIPSSVTSIRYGAFEGTSTLAIVNFLGNAPLVEDDAFLGIASGAKAIIGANATGFGTESIWNGLEIERSVSVPTHTVSYNSAGGSSVNSGSFTEGGTIQTAPVSTRSGYTLAGWSTAASGSVVTFPYAPGVTADITLHAIWTPIKTPAKTATISYSANFPSGTSALSATGKKAISKIVKKAGKNAKYTVTGVASKSVGVTSSKVKARAKSRAEAVKAYLIKLGVKKTNITIKIAIVESGITPKTKILAKYLAS